MKTLIQDLNLRSETIKLLTVVLLLFPHYLSNSMISYANN